MWKEVSEAIEIKKAIRNENYKLNAENMKTTFCGDQVDLTKVPELGSF